MAKEQRLVDAMDYVTQISKKVQPMLRIGCSTRKLYDTILGCIADAPTVDAVEVVRGEWLDGCAIHNGKEVYQSIDCSECEEAFKIESHDRAYWKKRFKVCPFCGAVMDGGNEGMRE